ncbi:MAG: PAS domain S-box protein [Deltaproteobacteria bacterium]|nr:PAS domain S-box protein [Deltaproteobacteria bacterium]
MSLRLKTTIIIIIATAVLLGLLWGVSSIIVGRGFGRVEEADMRHSLEVLLSALNNEIQNITAANADYAFWDDTCEFIETGSETYMTVNFTEDTFTDFRLNFVLFVDLSGWVVYARGFDLKAGRERPVPRSLTKAAHIQRFLIGEAEIDRCLSGIVTLPEGNVLISSCPIINSRKEGPVRGALIMGRYLDELEVYRLSGMLHLPVTLFPFRDGVMPPEVAHVYAEGGGKDGFAVQPIDERTIAGYAIVNDMDGKPALALRAEKPRAIHLQSQKTLRYFVIILVIAAAVFASIIFQLLEISVLSRLRRIQKKVQVIGSTRQFSERLSEPGRDELASLSADIDYMIENIEKEQKLRQESEERYRLHFLHSSDVFYTLSPDFVVQDVSGSVERIMGYKPEEMIGRNFLELNILAPESLDRAVADTGKVLAGGTVKASVYRFITRDGQERFGEVSGIPVYRDGRVTAIVSVGRDITERRLVEEALQESEERFRAIAVTARDAIIMMDGEGAITYWNPAAESVFGYGNSEALGSDLHTLLAPERYQAAYREGVRKFRYTGSGDAVGKTLELEAVRKDGTEILVELSLSSIQMKGDWYAVGIVRDITERKETEELLRLSKERYQNLVENINDIVYTIDEGGVITYVSPSVETITDYTVSDLVGTNFIDLVHQDDLPLVMTRFREIINGDIGPAEYRMIMKSGTARWVRTSSRPIMADGFFAGMTGLLVDVDDRKDAELELQSQREHLELINKILRHDLINDLTIIKSALNLYQETGEAELLEESTKHVDKSVGLIRTMKEFESFIAAHSELKIYNIGELLLSLSKNYPSLAVTVEGSGRVLADESLSSVIDNILRNAVIHGKTDRVSVTIETEEQFCVVRIADYGKGIPADVRDKVFDEGFMFGETGQTGLGLHIVKRAMDNYGGTVHVEENTPQGAVFVLRFRSIAGSR